MGIFSWLGLGKSLADPINAVGNLYTTDKARIEAHAKLEEVTQKPQLEQLKTNEILASASSLFKSGWISLIGWTAGFLVLLYYLPQLIIVTYIWAKASLVSGIIAPYPIKPDDILNLVWLLFGFGGYSLIQRKF